jgi:hypothetical protein
MHIPIEFVSPVVWKRSYGLSKDKHASLHRARLLFPTAELHLAKHDGRAEALADCRVRPAHVDGEDRSRLRSEAKAIEPLPEPTALPKAMLPS